MPAFFNSQLMASILMMSNVHIRRVGGIVRYSVLFTDLKHSFVRACFTHICKIFVVIIGLSALQHLNGCSIFSGFTRNMI